MRAFVAVVIAGCAGSQPPPRQDHPIANHASAAIFVDPSPCEDVVQGQLYAPVMQVKLSIVSLGVRTLRDHQSDWFGCYNDRLHREPSVEGKVELSFVVEKTGRAGHVRTVGFDAQIDRCICDRVRAIEFDKGIAGEHVTYPIEFKSGR